MSSDNFIQNGNKQILLKKGGDLQTTPVCNNRRCQLDSAKDGHITQTISVPYFHFSFSPFSLSPRRSCQQNSDNQVKAIE